MQIYQMGYLSGVYYTLKHWQHHSIINTYIKMWKAVLVNNMMTTGSLPFKASVFNEAVMDGYRDTMTAILQHQSY